MVILEKNDVVRLKATEWDNYSNYYWKIIDIGLREVVISSCIDNGNLDGIYSNRVVHISRVEEILVQIDKDPSRPYKCPYVIKKVINQNEKEKEEMLSTNNDLTTSIDMKRELYVEKLEKNKTILEEHIANAQNDVDSEKIESLKVRIKHLEGNLTNEEFADLEAKSNAVIREGNDKVTGLNNVLNDINKFLPLAVDSVDETIRVGVFTHEKLIQLKTVQNLLK